MDCLSIRYHAYSDSSSHSYVSQRFANFVSSQPKLRKSCSIHISINIGFEPLKVTCQSLQNIDTFPQLFRSGSDWAIDLIGFVQANRPKRGNPNKINWRTDLFIFSYKRITALPYKGQDLLKGLIGILIGDPVLAFEDAEI